MATHSGTRKAQKLLVHGVLIVLSLIFLTPLIWLVLTSLKTNTEATAVVPTLFPKDWQWENYWEAISYNSENLGYLPFVVYGLNTIALTFLVVAGTTISNSIVAYSFARLRWRGRDAFFAVTLATMMIPFPVLMVPLFSVFTRLGWVGTFRPLWVPAWFGAAFSIFLLRQFFRTVPFELSEAAKLDGCSEWGIFTRVVLPLSKPALIVVALFSFIATWNDFLAPLIYLQNQKAFTLALGLQAYNSQSGGTPWNLLMAASAVVVLPVILLFFLAQRFFIQGITLTGMKN